MSTTRRDNSAIVAKVTASWEKLPQDRLNASIARTTIRDARVVGKKISTGPRLPVECINIDTFECAEMALTSGYRRVLVLNFASDKKPGGGWRTTGRAQEEALCHASTLGKTLEAHAARYPLKSHDVILSPDICVFQNASGLPVTPFWCDVVSVAAIRNPVHKPDGSYSDSDYELMTAKITAVFDAAVANGNDAIVLGAFGCGVFGNSPANVASIFKNVIVQRGYDRIKLYFAIIGDNQNFRIFKLMFNPETRPVGIPGSAAAAAAATATKSAKAGSGAAAAGSAAASAASTTVPAAKPASASAAAPAAKPASASTASAAAPAAKPTKAKPPSPEPVDVADETSSTTKATKATHVTKASGAPKPANATKPTKAPAKK
jgi:uncharacterized protein (TIGR02452 family)